MTLMLFLAGVFFICMAMLWTEGFWGNTLTYINVVVSGMVAVTLWESVAKAMEKPMSSFTYVLDIIAVWLVFAVTMGILRGISDYLSKYRVRFHRLMETIGNMTMAVLVAATMTAFAGWTLHMAPLAPNPFRGANLSSSFLCNVWGRAMEFSSSGTATGGNTFSQGGYDSRYSQRRQALAKLEGFRTGSQ